ncbi:MAG: carbohydrate binding family 9 domain-containing protein, partial [Blastocatellia bacterium]
MSNDTLKPLRVVSLLMLILLASVQAAPQSKRLSVAPLNDKLTLDGLLTEPVWAQAALLGEIQQREPKPESVASERTEVRLLKDKDTLYIGVLCYDSEPAKVVGTQMARDADLEIDDSVAILLDTFHDRRNAFYFATNPAGALIDGLIVENQRTINFNWNAIWNVRAKRTPQGWSAEFAIPFKSLSFNPGQDVWGFNFSRVIVRKIEEDRWATPRLDVEFTQVSEAGELTGFAEIEQGRGLDVRPFAVGRWSKDAGGKDRFEGDVGGDIFFNLTPGLRLTSTVNTDFAETEVDNRQINLTRFP